jgi:hypothetical protein
VTATSADARRARHVRYTRKAHALLATCACAGVTGALHAQEMLSMPAATAPSPGVLIPRMQARAFFYEEGQSLLEQDIRLEYGLARDLSISAELPLYEGFFDPPRPSDGEFGLGDLEAIVELRVLREDLDAISTLRAAVYAGAELPTGTGGFGGDSVDPCVGAVLTGIFGRHGFDAAARWTFVTGDGPFLPIFAGDEGDDFANVDLGYAYRIAPDEYGEERVGAWYATLELNTVWTTGGEHEVLLSPGLLLEAPTYAVELGVQLPVASEVGDRPELRLGLVAGIRLIF